MSIRRSFITSPAGAGKWPLIPKPKRQISGLNTIQYGLLFILEGPPLCERAPMPRMLYAYTPHNPAPKPALPVLLACAASIAAEAKLMPNGGLLLWFIEPRDLISIAPCSEKGN